MGGAISENYKVIWTKPYSALTGFNEPKDNMNYCDNERMMTAGAKSTRIAKQLVRSSARKGFY